MKKGYENQPVEIPKRDGNPENPIYRRSMIEYIQRAWRHYDQWMAPVCWFRAVLWKMRGARIGSRTRLPHVHVTWPHQIKIGDRCILQRNIFFNYDNHWTPGPSIILGDHVFVGRGVEFNIQGRIEIGDNALIASGCVFVDHDHGMSPGTSMNKQPNEILPIRIGSGVWIGTGCIVLKGVEVGEGAVIGAGSIVTKSIPPREIWCGIPARRIGCRKSDEIRRNTEIFT